MIDDAIVPTWPCWNTGGGSICPTLFDGAAEEELLILVEVMIDTKVIRVAVIIGPCAVGRVVSFRATLPQNTRRIETVADREVIRFRHRRVKLFH